MTKKNEAPVKAEAKKGEVKKTAKNGANGFNLAKFITEVKVEMKKVTWPSKNVLINQTIIVLVTVILLAAFLGIGDGIFSLLYSYIK